MLLAFTLMSLPQVCPNHIALQLSVAGHHQDCPLEKPTMSHRIIAYMNLFIVSSPTRMSTLPEKGPCVSYLKLSSQNPQHSVGHRLVVGSTAEY